MTTTNSNNPMNNLLAYHARLKTPILMRLRHDPAPCGPGAIEPFDTMALAEPVADVKGLYTFHMPIQQGQVRGVLPITFHVDDVLWISPGGIPVKDKEPKIVVANGPLSFGGRA